MWDRETPPGAPQHLCWPGHNKASLQLTGPGCLWKMGTVDGRRMTTHGLALEEKSMLYATAHPKPRADPIPSVGCYPKDLGSRHGAHRALSDCRQQQELSRTWLQLLGAVCNTLGVFRKLAFARLPSKASRFAHRWCCEITPVLLSSW